MTLQDARVGFNQLLQSEDVLSARLLLSAFPGLINDPATCADMMISAAMHCATPSFVALLHGLGISMDVASTSDPIMRPLYAAASPGRWPTMRWLVEHGAEVNWEVSGRTPYCVPLPTVIRAGQLDIVRLLVEAGGKLDVRDRRSRTPLDWAIAYGQHDIAEYLRSRNRDYADRMQDSTLSASQSPICGYLADKFGWAGDYGWHSLVPDPANVTVRDVQHPDFTGVITDGLSSHMMIAPKGKERYRFAELAAVFGHHWPSDPKRWSEERYVWVINWLRQIANQMCISRTWLGDPHFILANGDAPDPLSPFTKMTCWLGLVDKLPLTGFRLADGSEVVFYTLYPLHTAERDFEREHGLRALLELFAEHDVSLDLNPARVSVI